VVASRLGDRVARWATHNEPWCIATLGHEAGEHAPGHRDPAEALRVAHHLLLSHGWAAEAVRTSAPGAEVGIVLNLVPVQPASPDPADIEAARRLDGSFNRWYLDPLFLGSYPEDAIGDRIRRGHLEGADLPFVHSGDLGAVSAPLDFLGLNYYTRIVVKAGEGGEPVAVPVAPEGDLTEMGWEVHPRGLHDLLLRIQRDYAPPAVYITENGAAFPDPPPVEGRVADARRVAYLRGHLDAAHRALADGVPLRGYFVWSLLDNFEWAHGYTKRFGLYRVDSSTRQRIPKDSAFWYRDVVAANGVHDEAPRLAARRHS
jgi:beta-glucosidase